MRLPHPLKKISPVWFGSNGRSIPRSQRAGDFLPLGKGEKEKSRKEVLPSPYRRKPLPLFFKYPFTKRVFFDII